VVEQDRSKVSAPTEDHLVLYSCCATIASLIPVLLYQTGVSRSLPDPPLPVFDSEKITSSRQSRVAGLPDSVPALLNFSTTLALILLARRNQPLKKALGIKLLADGSAGCFNMGRQVTAFHKLCSWCTATALATTATAFLGRALIKDAFSGNWSR
jgi:uncharacterized membrane protein